MSNNGDGPGSYNPIGRPWTSKDQQIRDLRARRSSLLTARHVQQTATEPSSAKLAQIEDELGAVEAELKAAGESLD